MDHIVLRTMFWWYCIALFANWKIIDYVRWSNWWRRSKNLGQMGSTILASILMQDALHSIDSPLLGCQAKLLVKKLHPDYLDEWGIFLEPCPFLCLQIWSCIPAYYLCSIHCQWSWLLRCDLDFYRSSFCRCISRYRKKYYICLLSTYL